MKLILKNEETWIDNTKIVIKSLPLADIVRQKKLSPELRNPHGRFKLYYKDDEVVLELNFDQVNEMTEIELVGSGVLFF